jgi:biofilm PGA synthesis N-glycosyltransferase PgaC
MDTLRSISAFLPYFCFAYPFIMAWYWMAGGLYYHFWRERGLSHRAAAARCLPPFSILVPCYNNPKRRWSDRRAPDRLSGFRDHRDQ